MSARQKSNGKKIFQIGIADDHVQTAISLAQVLDFAGFKTFQAYNEKDAIKLAQTEKLDLLVLDIRMDGTTGYGVAEALPNQKIIFMTGYEFGETKISNLKNVVGILKKPVDSAELIKSVKGVLKI